MAKNKYTYFCERIRQARQSRGLTQAQAAKQMDMTIRILSRLEMGDCSPQASELKILCDFYEVSPAFLFGAED